jgi:hypothetical protein
VLDLSCNEVSLLSDLDSLTSLETLLLSSNLLGDEGSVGHLRVGAGDACMTHPRDCLSCTQKRPPHFLDGCTDRLCQAVMLCWE